MNQGPMPFGFPLPHPGWFAPPPAFAPAPAPAPAPSAPKNVPNINYPSIGDWLRYCDQQPARSGENFGALVHKFTDEGYRRINQLTGDRMSIENMSKWLGIGKGTADLIIQYAEEDTALLRNGEFKMDSYNTNDGYF